MYIFWMYFSLSIISWMYLFIYLFMLTYFFIHTNVWFIPHIIVNQLIKKCLLPPTSHIQVQIIKQYQLLLLQLMFIFLINMNVKVLLTWHARVSMTGELALKDIRAKETGIIVKNFFPQKNYSFCRTHFDKMKICRCWIVLVVNVGIIASSLMLFCLVFLVHIVLLNVLYY